MTEAAEERRPTLLGGVGYPDLRDYSAGVVVVERLLGEAWPPDVLVEDVSYNPIALVQRLEDEPIRRAVLVGAVSRRGRPAGTLTAYRWDGRLPPPDRIQAAVAEAVTGVISLDNTLVIVRHFGALPEDTVVLEIEPEAHEFGHELSAAVAASVERACSLVRALLTGPVDLPRAALGGGLVEEGAARLAEAGTR